MFQIMELLLVFQCLQPSEGGLYCDGRSGVAGPHTVFMQEPQCQSPTAHLFILVLPQKEQVYLVCWLISIFFTVFLREAP